METESPSSRDVGSSGCDIHHQMGQPLPRSLLDSESNWFHRGSTGEQATKVFLAIPAIFLFACASMLFLGWFGPILGPMLAIVPAYWLIFVGVPIIVLSVAGWKMGQQQLAHYQQNQGHYPSTETISAYVEQVRERTKNAAS